MLLQMLKTIKQLITLGPQQVTLAPRQSIAPSAAHALSLSLDLGCLPKDMLSFTIHTWRTLGTSQTPAPGASVTHGEHSHTHIAAVLFLLVHLVMSCIKLGLDTTGSPLENAMVSRRGQWQACVPHVKSKADCFSDWPCLAVLGPF